MEKIIIVGGGPAGLTAGIFLSRDNIPVQIIEKFAIGGNMLLAGKVENYPGFPEGISGFDLSENMKKQFLNFGGEIKTGEVTKIEIEDDKKIIVLKDGEILKTPVVIIATGSSRKKLDIPGEIKLIGKGVSYCAICDGYFFKDKDIVIIGGGDSAFEEAIYLTKFAKKIYLIHRREKFRARKYLQDRVRNNEKIEILTPYVPIEIIGEDKVEKLLIKHVSDKKILELKIDGIFISAGSKPNTEFLNSLIITDENGFIIVNEKMETNISGIFACGDCIKKSVYQIITACSEGMIAGFYAEKYFENYISE